MKHTRYKAPLFLSDAAMSLLANAESIVYEECCENNCLHFREGIYPGECGHFKPPDIPLIDCESYCEKGAVMNEQA